MSRYVGGLVSICDLLEYSSDESPFQTERIDSIRHQARSIGPQTVTRVCPRLKTVNDGLESPTGMWFPNIDFFTSEGISNVCDDTTTTPADTGSNILEYGRLSELSRDLQYVNNVAFVFNKTDGRQRLPGGP